MSRFPNRDRSGDRVSHRSDSIYILEWLLRPWWRAAAFLLLILALALALAAETIRVARVTAQADTLSIIDLQAGLRWDPGNSDLIHRLGLVYSFNPTEINLNEAVKYLRKAIELNPRHWDFWTDLGVTCDSLGDTACSDAAFERALSLNPMMPALRWAVANHFLLTDREDLAFRSFRALLDLDPTYLDPTFRLCFRATRDPQAIYAGVVPQGSDPAPRFAFLMFLCSRSDYQNAMQIWGQMKSGPDRTPPIGMVKPFLDLLIDHSRIQDAETVWDDLQRAGVIPPAPGRQSANLIDDGDFARPPLNTGFDWRVNDSPYLAFDFSDSSAYKGSKCARIDFAVGGNWDYNLLSQVVLVEPNTAYHLMAYVRSDNLTSDSGPRLRLEQLDCGSCEVRTSDPTVGTTDWHPIDISFLTEAQTGAVRVSFWRPQDQAYSRDITGTVWLDDVILTAADTPGSILNQARSR